MLGEKPFSRKRRNRVTLVGSLIRRHFVVFSRERMLPNRMNCQDILSTRPELDKVSLSSKPASASNSTREVVADRSKPLLPPRQRKNMNGSAAVCGRAAEAGFHSRFRFRISSAFAKRTAESFRSRFVVNDSSLACEEDLAVCYAICKTFYAVFSTALLDGLISPVTHTLRLLWYSS